MNELRSELSISTGKSEWEKTIFNWLKSAVMPSGHCWSYAQTIHSPKMAARHRELNITELRKFSASTIRLNLAVVQPEVRGVTSPLTSRSDLKLLTIFPGLFEV